MNKPAHGGARPGAGRPKGEPTKTLAYRVPERVSGRIDKAIRKVIASELNKLTQSS